MWSGLIRLAAALAAFVAAMAVTRLGPAVLGRTTHLMLEIGVWGCLLLAFVGVVLIFAARGRRMRR